MIEKVLLAGRTKKDWSVKKAGVICTLRAAALIIKDNKFLAAKSTDYDCYYTVGGGIEINETSEEAVIREVYEETGYRLEIDKLAFVQER
ncbi:MAG: hydrolase, partial [Clostridia bacterium]|nr:hydrolase [Clostridia bacterium]